MCGLLSYIFRQYPSDCIPVSEARDLLQSLAAKLYSMPEMHSHFIQAKLDFSILGLGISLENTVPVTDIENAIELMLAEIQKRHKRLLITVDEVTNCEYIRIFSSSYQIFLRQNGFSLHSESYILYFITCLIANSVVYCKKYRKGHSNNIIWNKIFFTGRNTIYCKIPI